MKDGSIPTVARSATLEVLGVTLTVHMLSDGMRVIDEASMIAFLNALYSPDVVLGEKESEAVNSLLNTDLLPRVPVSGTSPEVQ